MHKLNVSKTGVAVGLFSGLVHLVWSLVVWSGSAQSLTDWKMSMHFLNNPFTVGTFGIVGGVELVIFGIIGGYVVGAVFAAIYNSVNK